MSARGLEVGWLRGDEKERVRSLLDEKPILAEPATALAGLPWIAVAASGLLVLAIAATRGESIGVLGWMAYGIGAAMLARGAIGARGALRGVPATWPRGRFVYPFGFIEMRGPIFRILPVEDFERSTVKASTGDRRVVHTIDLEFADGAIERFHHATGVGQTFTPALQQLSEARDAVRAGRDLARYQLVGAGTRPPPARWSKRRAWLVSGGIGLAAQAFAYVVVLPPKATALAAAGDATYAAARSRLHDRVRNPAVRGPLLVAVDELAHAQATTIGVRLAPLDAAEVDAATAWYREHVGPDHLAPMVPVIGLDDAVIAQLQSLLAGTGLSFGSPGAAGPVVDIALHLRPGGPAIKPTRGGKTYVNVELDFEAVLAMAEKAVPLGARITVPPVEDAKVVFHNLPSDQASERAGDGLDGLVYREVLLYQLRLAAGAWVRQAEGP